MSTLTILGSEYEVRGLTPAGLTQWNAHLVKLLARNFWTDLYATVKDLPPRLQEVIFSGARRPAKLDKFEYFNLATQPKSVKLLVSMTVLDGDSIVVDEENAVEIFWVLRPLIVNRPVILPGGEGLAKLREVSDAG